MTQEKLNGETVRAARVPRGGGLGGGQGPDRSAGQAVVALAWSFSAALFFRSNTLKDDVICPFHFRLISAEWWAQ